MQLNSNRRVLWSVLIVVQSLSEKRLHAEGGVAITFAFNADAAMQNMRLKVRINRKIKRQYGS
nr:MAG TPA: hypothetical protein [Bacteriophage sp.]